ncbi:MAG: TAXI family TRAP transporter solute-binding subunit [Hyphomonadaceae bacterium]
MSDRMKDILKIAVPSVLLALAGLLAAFWLMGPPVPKQVTIAGGSLGGVYAQTAERLSTAMGERKINAEVLTTAGSVDNIRRLQSGEAQIGIVQTGLAGDIDTEGLQSLGAIFFEPLWVFHRSDAPMSDLRDLRGLKVAVGAEGSGTRVLVDLLMQEAGVAAGDFTPADLSGVAAASAVKSGEVDAALIVSSPEADWILDLLADPSVELMSMDRAPALARRHTYLDSVTLYAGVLDPARGLPAGDVTLTAPSAEIVVSDALHPALQSLLMDIAFRDFSGGTLLSDPEAFPTRDLADIPLSEEAQRYYKNGPTFLRRVFNYDVANFLERAWVIAIPLLTLAYPLAKAGPPLYRWRTRRKIYVWYEDLRALEGEGRAAESPEQRAAVRGKLAELQAETGRVEVPLSYTDDLYRLRAHIRFVAELIDRLSVQDRSAQV